MAKSVNKVILVGNLGKDPELKHTSSGTAVASFSMATTSSYKDKSGEWKDQTEWHNIVLWARQAEIAAEYLKKGNKVYIEGRLQTRSWEDKQGQKRYTTEVVANELVLMGGGGQGGGGNRGGGDEYSQRGGHSDFDQSGGGGGFDSPSSSARAGEITDDDIPF